MVLGTQIQKEGREFIVKENQDSAMSAYDVTSGELEWTLSD